jgi:hypothetical protein
MARRGVLDEQVLPNLSPVRPGRLQGLGDINRRDYDGQEGRSDHCQQLRNRNRPPPSPTGSALIDLPRGQRRIIDEPLADRRPDTREAHAGRGARRSLSGAGKRAPAEGEVQPAEALGLKLQTLTPRTRRRSNGLGDQKVVSPPAPPAPRPLPSALVTCVERRARPAAREGPPPGDARSPPPLSDQRRRTRRTPSPQTPSAGSSPRRKLKITGVPHSMSPARRHAVRVP